MERNSPINSVYLIALAVCTLLVKVNSLISALLFAVVVVAVFLVSVSIVAMIEKIADKNVRFLMFVLVASMLVTILKVVCGYINVPEVKNVNASLEFAILPCILMAIVPIYFEDTLTVKEFFSGSFLQCFGFILMLALYGFITELLGFGSICGKLLTVKFLGLPFFAMPYGGLMVIATLAVLFNIVRRAYIKKTKRYNMLVAKYKVQIQGILEDDRQKKEAGKL